MPLSWNEIRHNAIRFAREHKDTASEQGERQTFRDGFSGVFGKKRKHLAAFEEPVKKLSGHWGFIDLFWPGKCIVILCREDNTFRGIVFHPCPVAGER